MDSLTAGVLLYGASMILAEIIVFLILPKLKRRKVNR